MPWCRFPPPPRFSSSILREGVGSKIDGDCLNWRTSWAMLSSRTLGWLLELAIILSTIHSHRCTFMFVLFLFWWTLILGSCFKNHLPCWNPVTVGGSPPGYSSLKGTPIKPAASSSPLRIFTTRTWQLLPSNVWTSLTLGPVRNADDFQHVFQTYPTFKIDQPHTIHEVYRDTNIN